MPDKPFDLHENTFEKMQSSAARFELTCGDPAETMWRFDGDCAVINDSNATASVMPRKQALILIAEDEVEIAGAPPRLQ
jgi:hypothetical protein